MGNEIISKLLKISDVLKVEISEEIWVATPLMTSELNFKEGCGQGVEREPLISFLGLSGFFSVISGINSGKCM